MIQIRGLRKSFGKERALVGVDAELPAGAIACVVGPSGCGKSTLLRCLNGLETMDEGQIAIAGVTLTPRTPRPVLDKLRREVGMVFQELFLFPHLSVIDNVTLAPRIVSSKKRETARAEGIELLRSLGLDARAEARPSELSGGQKQRVAIARALAQGARVLLLDEPTSALDPEMRDEVRDVLRGVKERGLTMVVVTHDMRLATGLGSDLWVMDAGAIVERGEPRSLLASPSSDVAKDFFARLS
jgi:glutamine transport system ATP-binding protein